MTDRETEDGIPERLGQKVNELDIDFSNFTFAGWIVVAATLASGLSVGWLILQNVGWRNAMDKGPALMIGVGGLATAIVTFFGMRLLFQTLGVPIVRKP